MPSLRVVRSVGYGRGGRGASASRRPLSIPGGARSDTIARIPGAASCATTLPAASVRSVRTAAGLGRNMQDLDEDRQAGDPMLLQVCERIDPVERGIDRRLD